MFLSHPRVHHTTCLASGLCAGRTKSTYVRYNLSGLRHRGSGSLTWSQNNVITSWLRLTVTSNCFPHPYSTYTQCLSTSICCPFAYSCSLTQFTHSSCRLRIWGFESLVESKWCDYVIVEADSHLKLLSTSILDIYTEFEQINMLSIGIWQQPYTDTHPNWLRFWGSGSLVESKWCHYVTVEVTATSNCFTSS